MKPKKVSNSEKLTKWGKTMEKEDKEFIERLKEAIDNEEYDSFLAENGDEWEIIERLLKIIESK